METSEILLFENEFFNEKSEEFIIYVVDKNFSINRGFSYFKSYEGKENYIYKNQDAQTFIKKILFWIEKKIPNVKDLIEKCFYSSSSPNIIDIITSLCKLFSANEHQAAGPEVLDPIIIQEGEIKQKDITQIISLHKDSFLRPTIIIILQDNNFSRAVKMLRFCPHGTIVKFIRNSGASRLEAIVNTGVDNVDDFLKIYSRQCFNACSRTERGIIYNPEWAEDSLIKLLSPSLLRLRSLLLFDKKEEAISGVNICIDSIQKKKASSLRDKNLLASLECMTKIFRVYCYDYGGNDILDSLKIAKELDNEILLAHVLRYARLIPQNPFDKQKEMCQRARDIFSSNKMEDYAVYCQNNLLVNNFDLGKPSTIDFEKLTERAINNVPGLIGMPIIYNNTGVSFLYQNKFDEAVNYLKKGLKKNTDRMIQQAGLRTNILIAKHLDGQEVSENEIKNVINLILIHIGTKDKAFLSASYIVNLLAISLNQEGLTSALLKTLPLEELLINALPQTKLGSANLGFQLQRLSKIYKEFQLPITLNQSYKQPDGIRGRYIATTGFNPGTYNAWL